MANTNYSFGQQVEIINIDTNEVIKGTVTYHYGSGDKTKSVWIYMENGSSMSFSTKTGKIYGKVNSRVNSQYKLKTN